MRIEQMKLMRREQNRADENRADEADEKRTE